MTKLQEVTHDTFPTEVLQSDALVLVDFWAEWCAPCRMLAPTLEELASELGDAVKFVKVNVDEDSELAGEFGVMSIPTLLLFREGEPVERILGVLPREQLKGKIEDHIGE